MGPSGVGGTLGVVTIPAPPTGVPPYVLISGPEGLLAERALASTVDALRANDPGMEVIRLYAAAYEGGELTVHASPSLFGGAKAIVVHDLDEASDDLQKDVLDHLAAPTDEVTLVVLHKGGQGGKATSARSSSAGRTSRS